MVTRRCSGLEEMHFWRADRWWYGDQGLTLGSRRRFGQTTTIAYFLVERLRWYCKQMKGEGTYRKDLLGPVEFRFALVLVFFLLVAGRKDTAWKRFVYAVMKKTNQLAALDVFFSDLLLVTGRSPFAPTRWHVHVGLCGSWPSYQAGGELISFGEWRLIT